jgi:serine/threonine protein kinase
MLKRKNNVENAELDLNTEPMEQTASPNVQLSGSENCLPLGTRLSEFELTGIIGEGGFGSVYLAIDHSLQRTVAIKEYMPSALAGRNSDQSVVVRSQRHQETFATGLRSFINEARLLAQFDHPALIKVHRFWEQNNTAYMAMRYYEGQTLKNVIKNHASMVTERWLKTMLVPILEALDALYKVNILHRDISPDNIMIQNTGGAVLLDFGAARQIIGDMTQALTVILKPGYAPVEQYADDTSMKQGPWTDIYALSAVLYAAITKKPPPTSVARMIKDPIELLDNNKYPEFSVEFLSAINKGLSVNPEHRPQSIEEFRKLLNINDVVVVLADLPAPVLAPVITKQPFIAADDATIIILPPKAKPQTDQKEAPKPPKETKTKTSSSKAPPPGGVPTVRPKKRPFVIIGLLVLLGVCSVAAFLYYNPNAISNVAPDVASQSAPVADPPPVVAAPVDTLAPPQSAATVVATEEESKAWDALKDGTPATPDIIVNLVSFLGKYPSGNFTDLARAKLTALNGDSAKFVETTAPVAPPEPVVDPKQAAIDAEAAKPSGTIGLTIKPWGYIYVDDVSKGVSPPIKKLRLPVGKHQVKVVNAGFPDFVSIIEVTTNNSINIEHDFSSH